MKVSTKILEVAKELNMTALILEEATLDDIDNQFRLGQELCLPPDDSYSYWIEVESRQTGEKISTVVLQSAQTDDIEEALGWLRVLQYVNPYDYHFYLVVNYDGSDCVNAVEFVAADSKEEL